MGHDAAEGLRTYGHSAVLLAPYFLLWPVSEEGDGTLAGVSPPRRDEGVPEDFSERLSAFKESTRLT